MKMKRLYLLFLPMLFISCAVLRKGEKTVEDEKIIQLYQKNISSYSDTVKVAGYELVCTKMPYQIELLQNLQLGSITQEEYQQLKQEKSGYELVYFSMVNELSKTDFFACENGYSEEQKFDFLLYHAKKQIKLISDTDTVSCSGFHLEQNPMLPNTKRMQLYFPKSKSKEMIFWIPSNPIIDMQVKMNIYDIEKQLN